MPSAKNQYQMTTTDKKPAWKAFQDEQLRKVKLEQAIKAQAEIQNYLKINNFQFTIPVEPDELFRIKLNSLISRKELTKLLELTFEKLGIQIFQNEIQIYTLGTKIPK